MFFEADIGELFTHYLVSASDDSTIKIFDPYESFACIQTIKLDHAYHGISSLIDYYYEKEKKFFLFILTCDIKNEVRKTYPW